jgi:outer membrane protein assembly factor BamB
VRHGGPQWFLDAVVCIMVPCVQGEQGEVFGGNNPHAGDARAGLHCSECGELIVPGNRFCTSCGASTDDATTPAPMLEPVEATGLSQPQEIEERGPRRSRWIVVGAVVVLVAGATAVVVRARGGDSSPKSGGAVLTPSFALARSVDNDAWSVDIDEFTGLQISDDRVFVMSSFTDPEVAAISLSSGEEQWSVDLDVETAGVGVVVDGRVLLTATDNAGADTLILSLDAKTGEEQWRQDVDAGSLTTTGGRVLYWQYGTKTTVEVIDPATGESEKRLRYDQISERNGRLVAIDDDQLRQFSLDTFDEIGEPIPWDSGYSSFLVVPAGVYVINDGDEMIRLDQSGKRAWSASTGDDELFSLTDLGNGLIAVSGNEGTTVGRERGNDFEEVWNTDGFIGTVFKAGGTVVATVFDELDLSFVDTATGDEMASVEVPPDTLNLWPMSNGAIVRLNDDSSEFAGLSLPSGDEQWRFSEDFAFIEPFEGGVLVVARDNVDDTETTITRRN